MKRFAFLLMAAVCLSLTASQKADAQHGRQFAQQKAVKVVAPSRPKLGINGYMVQRGYKLTYVAPRSVAQRMGLERGDIIHAINETALASEENVIHLLDRAAGPLYQGNFSLRVENIRWHLGQSDERHLFLKGNLYR